MASSELLKQIQAGKKLKRAETNDRSAPQVDTPKSSGGSKGSTASPSSAPLALSGGFGGPPQPGSLFAGGMPKLKPAGQSKLGNLAKPPSVQKFPTPPDPVPAWKNDTSSSAPLPPRRAAPVRRSESPPAAPPRPRTQLAVSPAVPIRNPVASPTKPTPAPPPPRYGVPPPPSRKLPSAEIAATQDSAARTYSPEPDPISHLPPPSRRLPTNGDRLLARRKIPSPPPNAGVHTFPVTDFPAPRYFKNISKIYKSGNQRGSNFDLSIL